MRSFQYAYSLFGRRPVAYVLALTCVSRFMRSLVQWLHVNACLSVHPLTKNLNLGVFFLPSLELQAALVYSRVMQLWSCIARFLRAKGLSTGSWLVCCQGR